MKVAYVAVEKAAYHFDKLYTYHISQRMESTLVPGCRVTVPFGSGNKRRQGVVFSVGETDEEIQAKPIAQQLDAEPLLSEEMLALAKWLHSNCYCTLFEGARVMLPTGVNLRVVTAYRISERYSDEETSPNVYGLTEQLIVDLLRKSRATVEHGRMLEIIGDGCEKALAELCRDRVIVRVDDAVRNIGDATIKMARLSPQRDEDAKLTEKQRAVVELLEKTGSAAVKEICYFAGVSQDVVTRLGKAGIVEYFEAETYRNPYELVGESEHKRDIVLSEEQERAKKGLLEAYNEDKGAVSLLYGVTGSGKTSVFLSLIDSVIDNGRGIIVMIPEISLTPQTLAIFHERYGSRVAVFHSALSLGQRMDEWKRVKRGEAQIAVGTRSAVFAPFEKLGLIIIDEEQEYTYKSESTPRYHARDVAKFRAAYSKALVVLCSATPSVESYYNAVETKRYRLETLTGRYGSAVLPNVETVDISARNASDGILSETLRNALSENLENGYQSILLHNRRGYNTFVSCRACGRVLMCENCSVSMTYHHDNGRLMCHYCGSSTLFTRVCPYCGEEQLRYAGLGTQRVMEELEQLFPDARILRMDTDSVMTKSAHEQKLGSFGRGDYDIMVGTQMVAKGLDFERVTLVGVLMADLELYSDDFRSYERTFSLLTQVVGRSGRGKHNGRAVIQTMLPENEVIQLASRQDYLAFYESELEVRRAMLYPPFADICLVGFVGNADDAVRQAAMRFFKLLMQQAEESFKDVPLRVLGPSSAMISKVNLKYRYKLILKCRNSSRFRLMMDTLLCQYGKDKQNAEVTAYVDMNPDSVM